MSQNQNWGDLLKHIEKSFPRFEKINPAMTKAFANVMEVDHSAAALDAKTRELIAVGVAVALHCDGCIAYHVHQAKKAGATPAELGAALGTAMTIGIGSKFIQSIYVMDAYDQV